MIALTEVSDPVLLQLISDALSERNISFHVEHAGMSALLPLPGPMAARVMVEERELAAARRILSDLELDS